jgi:hypothetical protein
MNLLDYLVVAYLAFAAWRGTRNCVAFEGYRLLRVVVAVVVGVGLFSLIRKAMSVLLGFWAEGSGVIGFILIMGVSFYALRRVKAAVIGYLQAHIDEKWNRSGGAMAGLVRAVILVAVVVGFLSMVPVVKKAAGHSLVGRAMGWVVGDAR